jgi:hypothetical protein
VMKVETKSVTNFKCISKILIPIVDMLYKKIRSVCNFSVLKIVKIEPANKVEGFVFKMTCLYCLENITFHIFQFATRNGINKIFPYMYRHM